MDQPETATQENELQKEADAHRRCKVFYLQQGELRGLLRAHSGLPEAIKVPEPCESVPPDAKVISTFACPERASIGVVVAHPSYDVVPNGEMIPEANEWLRLSWRVLLLCGNTRCDQRTNQTA